MRREDFERGLREEINDITDLSTSLSAGILQRFDQHSGNVFYLDTASSPVLVSFDNKKEISIVQGQKISIKYRGFTLRSIAAQSVVLKHGYGNFSNSNQNVAVTTSATVENANVNTPQAEISVGAGATVQLVAANANRKSLRLAIPSTETGELYLTDALNSAKGGILEAGVIDYQDTEAAVFAHNYSASAVLVSVLEMERI